MFDKFETTAYCLGLLALLSAGAPLWHAWRRLRGSSLNHTVVWAWLAWLAWLAAGLAPFIALPAKPLLHIGGCFGAAKLVAVFGARRPGAAAWNFVIVGLLAVLLMPLLEQEWNSPHWQLDGPRSIFLSMTLTMGFVNYLPTRNWFFVIALGAAYALSVWALVSPNLAPAAIWRITLVVEVTIAITAWGSSALATRRGKSFAPDEWRRFRDAYGMVWGLRVIEQFNSAAANTNLKYRLNWSGLENVEAGTETEAARLLHATLKRFGFFESTA
jgi:hypothetical protein